MDFKSLITKISSLDDEIKTVAAPELPKPVQLNEDAELRVLAGTSSYIAEAKKKAEEKKEEKVDEEMKVGDKKKSSTGGTIEKTKTGVKHTAGKHYGGDKDDDKDEDDDEKPKSKKKAKKESIDPEAFKAKFTKMVEAKKDEKKDDKKKKPMKEAAKPDYIDLDKDGNKKETMKKAAADKKAHKKTESAMMPKGKKRPVKESVEQKLSFRDMMKLVVESGGQQQIDPLDKELFAWAERVANSKYTESMQQQVYAGLVYERMGGIFEMYDVLSEDQK